MQGISEEIHKELSAREIFNRIVKGQVIRIPNDPELASQLFNHLNVIKSREARIFRDLGLDFISSIISIEPIQLPSEHSIDLPIKPGQLIPIADESFPIQMDCYYEIKLKAPKIKKKYPSFIVKKDEPNSI